MTTPLLEARGLAKSYPGTGDGPVFRSVDLEVASGALVAVVGPSGCGKSTLLHILGHLEEPDEGSIRLGDSDYARLDDDSAALMRRDRIGFVFQFDHLLPELTLGENVAVPLRLAGVGRRAALERAREHLVEVGVEELEGRFPRELSGGERQRGAIARALVREPSLLLADEPTGNLDRESAERVLDTFRRLVRGPGRGAVVVTHDENVARGCDRVYRLRRDGLEELASP